FLLFRLTTPVRVTILLIVAPPILITWIATRLVKNRFETASALFWKGAAASCLLGAFANFCLMNPVDGGIEVPLIAFLLCAYMMRRSAAVKRVELKQGPLFERVPAIAHRASVSVNRLLVFTSPRNTPQAFAHRMGAILLSDRLLRVLSRQET